MRLLRLEMQGFKSFADKTVIQFGSGVTGVVGPNGCGKSNISDAIRWVLGEQSLKNLRGTKSEDVIFSGSTERRALNLAEVSLVFDNQDRFFDLDFNEISVGRRIYRSGEGEYLINKKTCRLKDVVELFRGTGLGRDALAVLGQNKIDELLSNTPEERRAAFEELAGISRYKSRKKEALKRLDQTEQNLNRVQDLTTTMGEELPALEEAKKRTEAHNQVRQEMRSGELRWIASEWANLNEQEVKLTEEQQSFANAESQAEEIRRQREEAELSFQKQFAESEKTLASWQEETERQKERLQEIQTEIAVQEERLQQNESLTALLSGDEAKQRTEQEELENLLSELNIRTGAAKRDLQKKEEELETLQKAHLELQTSWNKVQQVLESSRDEGFSSMQEIVSLRNRNQTLGDDQERLKRQESKFTKEREELADQVGDSSQKITQLQKERTSWEAQLKHVESQLETQRLELSRLTEERSSLVQTLEKYRQESRDYTSRLNWLGDILKNREGFSQGVRTLFSSNASWSSGLLGTVAELFIVSPEHRVALEVALGGAMQNVVCRTDEVAREAITYLKTKKAGRVTFLPLTTLQVSEIRKQDEELLKHPGCLGRASEFVTAKPELDLVVRFLLQRTLVVEDMETALEIGRKCRFSIRIVTLQGEILQPGGSLSGGSQGKERESFWNRREEAEELQKRISKLTDKIELEMTQVASLYEKIGKKEEQISLGEAQVQEGKVGQRVREEQEESLSRRLDILQRDLNELDEELSECREYQLKNLEQADEVRKNLAKAQEQEELRQKNLEQLQGQSGELVSQRENLQQKLTQMQMEVYGSQREITHLEERSQEIRQNLSTQRLQLQDMRKRLAETASAQEAGVTQLLTIQEEQDIRLKSLKEATEGTEKAELAWKNVQIQRQEREKAALLFEREEGKLREKRHEWEMRKQRLTFEQEKWQNYLQDEFELDIERALQEVDLEMSTEGLEARLAVLKNKLTEIGEVNPYAVDEYQRHLERYEFYQEQLEDLSKARQSLQRLINELNREMAEQFGLTFEAVNKKFQRVFVDLFGGGQARLNLTDPNNLLEAGVEIFVQPPGKKLQNLTLLSGGERALTVIALLFAFMEYRPSPFYLADEVDAALDEANVRRFSQFLKEYSKDTQFIVVTHRRGTMEIADTLHGVTMESAGVSSLISVRFEGDQFALENETSQKE